MHGITTPDSTCEGQGSTAAALKVASWHKAQTSQPTQMNRSDETFFQGCSSMPSLAGFAVWPSGTGKEDTRLSVLKEQMPCSLACYLQMLLQERGAYCWINKQNNVRSNGTGAVDDSTHRGESTEQRVVRRDGSSARRVMPGQWQTAPELHTELTRLWAWVGGLVLPKVLELPLQPAPEGRAGRGCLEPWRCGVLASIILQVLAGNGKTSI